MMRDYAAVGENTGKEAGLLIAGLQAMDAPVLLLDAQDRIINLTSSAEQLLGISASDLRGRAWPDVWASAAESGPPLSTEARRYLLRRPDRNLPVHAWVRSPVGGLSLVGLEDLSAAEEREREVARILYDLEEQSDDLFALYQITQFLNNEHDLDGLCTNLLRELERIIPSSAACLYLVNPQGSLQPKVWEGLPSEPPAQPDIVSAREWVMQQSTPEPSNQGKPRRSTGVFVLPLGAEDQLVGVAVLKHRGDIRGREQFLQTVAKEMGAALRAMRGRQALYAQEQKLEAIVDSTTDAIIQVGSDLQVRHFNPAAERLTGHTTAFALAHSCGDVLGCRAGEVRSGCGGDCPFARVLATGEPVSYAGIEVTNGGENLYLAASVSPLVPDREMDAMSVGILRDMSKQKQVEQLKDEFLITVSHQLRTPIALLRGYVDTLLHLKLSEQEQANCIDGIGETASRLEHLVGQILDVTRIEDGRLDLHREPVRIVDVVREAINTVPHSAYRSRIWTELEPNLPLVWVDLERLEEVVINLLDNSFKYSSPTGQIVIRASRGVNSLGNAEVVVQVLDEGIGVPPDEQAAVFEKFRRGSNALDMELTGTGLGLFICRSIIEAYGGDIRLTSTPHSGTCVTFRLPAVPQANIDSAIKTGKEG